MGRRTRKTDVFKQIDRSGGEDACWPWLGYFNEKKRTPYFQCGGVKYIPYVLVWELVTGETVPEGKQLLHSCDNRKCCNFKHLRVGTHQENMDEMQDRDRHGLPHHVVRNIRKLLEQGRPQQAIADLYGCSRETISAIATGRTHKRTPMATDDNSTTVSNDTEDEPNTRADDE